MVAPTETETETETETVGLYCRLTETSRAEMDGLAYRPRGAGATVAPDPPRAPPACDATGCRRSRLHLDRSRRRAAFGPVADMGGTRRPPRCFGLLQRVDLLFKHASLFFEGVYIVKERGSRSGMPTQIIDQLWMGPQRGGGCRGGGRRYIEIAGFG